MNGSPAVCVQVASREARPGGQACRDVIRCHRGQWPDDVVQAGAMLLGWPPLVFKSVVAGGQIEIRRGSQRAWTGRWGSPKTAGASALKPRLDALYVSPASGGSPELGSLQVAGDCRWFAAGLQLDVAR